MPAVSSRWCVWNASMNTVHACKIMRYTMKARRPTGFMLGNTPVRSVRHLRVVRQWFDAGNRHRVAVAPSQVTAAAVPTTAKACTTTAGAAPVG